MKNPRTFLIGIKFLFVALFCFPVLALANQAKSSVEIPVAIRNSFDSPFLVGSEKLKFLGMKVYNISLWSEVPEFSYEEPFAIHIKYNMSFSREDLVQKSIIEIEKLHKLNREEKIIYKESLNKTLCPVKKGDEKVAIFIPSKGVKMFHNNELTGIISDPKFSRLFIDIWLDERGSYPKITKKIKGKLNK